MNRFSAFMPQNQRLMWLLTIATFSVCLFVYLATQLYLSEHQKLSEKLQREVEKKAESLSWQLRSSINVLYQLEVLFYGSDHVSYPEFERVADGILARHIELQALEWVPRITHPQRAAAEQHWQQRYPDFIFTERHDGALVPARQRIYYYPIYFVVPVATNERAFGFDLGSDPSRLSALLRARDDGELVASSAVQLIQDDAKKKAILVIQPIFSQLTQTRAQRREHLKGYVLGVFRLSEMLHNNFTRDPNSLISYRLLDDSADGALLLEMGQVDYSQLPAAINISIPSVSGRHWRLQGIPQEHYYSSQISILPWAMGIGGSLAVLLLSIIWLQLLRQNVAIAQQVEQRTTELDEANSKLMALSLTDGLTGISNRRQFDEWLIQEWNDGKRHHRVLSLMMIDVDFFKKYNDNYGHHAGDQVLRKIASVLKDRLNRPRDLLARYGGEEFAVILPETCENVSVLAQALCDTVSQQRIPHKHGGNEGIVTISVGLMTLTPTDNNDYNHLLEMADQALYRAKADGRNRVVAYGSRPQLIEKNHGQSA
ncbi:MAG: diguanylate cyclase [Ferrimonas sp.]